jgi:hypothetical protein
VVDVEPIWAMLFAKVSNLYNLLDMDKKGLMGNSRHSRAKTSRACY